MSPVDWGAIALGVSAVAAINWYFFAARARGASPR